MQGEDGLGLAVASLRERNRLRKERRNRVTKGERLAEREGERAAEEGYCWSE